MHLCQHRTIRTSVAEHASFTNMESNQNHLETFFLALLKEQTQLHFETIQYCL